MNQSEANPSWPYRLGLPAWALPGWTGSYFRRSQPGRAEYAKVFNTVEGNTTFYRIPTPQLVDQWRDAVAGTYFRFSFKLPRTVTHDSRPALDDLDTFLRVIAPLGEHVGPLLVQFPSHVGPDSLERIEAVLARLPQDQSHALEVRHPAFFNHPEKLEPLLKRHQAARVTMDTRPLFRGDLNHPEVRAARHEKPDLPVLDTVYNQRRYLRLVLHPSGEGNQRYLEAWADRVAEDIDNGIRSYVFIHCPNNLHCPEMARTFHAALGQRLALAPFPIWPAGQSVQATLNL
ncbi:MAG: DUF72 domain-containing protein [Pseudomonadota bacterium]